MHGFNNIAPLLEGFFLSGNTNPESVSDGSHFISIIGKLVVRFELNIYLLYLRIIKKIVCLY